MAVPVLQHGFAGSEELWGSHAISRSCLISPLLLSQIAFLGFGVQALSQGEGALGECVVSVLFLARFSGGVFSHNAVSTPPHDSFA